MTDKALDALAGTDAVRSAAVHALTSPEAAAAGLINELRARGYEIVRTRTNRGDLRITGYPCTCEGGHRCLEHPFKPVREVGP